MKKHSKRAAKKERKHKKSTRGYRKGSKSKTMKGKKDFTTKKSSKVFNRRKHYQKHAEGSRVIRRPYAKKGGTVKSYKYNRYSPMRQQPMRRVAAQAGPVTLQKST